MAQHGDDRAESALVGADRIGEWLARLLRPAESVTPLSERLERIVLGGARRYTRLEVEERSGVPRERNARLWRALGFADVGDDDVVFTDVDVQALQLDRRFGPLGAHRPDHRGGGRPVRRPGPLAPGRVGDRPAQRLRGGAAAMADSIRRTRRPCCASPRRSCRSWSSCTRTSGVGTSSPWPGGRSPRRRTSSRARPSSSASPMSSATPG